MLHKKKVKGEEIFFFFEVFDGEENWEFSQVHHLEAQIITKREIERKSVNEKLFVIKGQIRSVCSAICTAQA